jgi:CRISPR-associated protein (TIGR02710 family)
MTTILICTVGGSYQPIVTAITEEKPDYVYFICTDRDLATNTPGSNLQITGKGNCIKARFSDDSPNLPNIPTITGLSSDQFSVYLTSSDELDQIYSDCKKVIQDALSLFPSSKIIADYTGGTKSMCAGLVMAAMEFEDIELQLITGSRNNLVAVNDGDQYRVFVNTKGIQFERLIAPYRQAWTRYAYSEAEDGLKQATVPQSADLRAQYTRFRDLSRAFAEWDNFNHQTALEILQRYARVLPADLCCYFDVAKRLNNEDHKLREAAQLLDLYRNAQRRATQGRYDDAIARVYRLIEWTAQWILRTQCHILTADVKEEDIPEGVSLTKNHENGQYQAGLFSAWQLVRFKTHGAASKFITAQENNMRNHIKVRNLSILAHGFEPVKVSDWKPIHSWLEEHFMPMLLAESASVRIKELPKQLPNVYTL